jgi:WS/DGAT/MGAT family acyltransferase
MHMLSALDASFIYLESDHSPMHIGGVYLIDAGDRPGSFNYASFCAHIERRLPCSRIFRQRLVEVTLSLSYPYWINDPDFELAQHLPRLHLPSPGGKKELMQLAAQVFGHTLERTRPLWELTFVDGLDTVPGLARGSFAVISKVHHAAVDGGSGVELMGALLDPDATPHYAAEKDNWQAEQLPGTARMVAAAYSRLGRKSVELGKLVSEVAAGAVRLYGSSRAKRINPPPMPLTAPASILNRPVSSSRTYWGVEFEFERIRRIRANFPGVTVNDVVLAVCAGGLRRYLLQRDALPDRPLVTMVPISVRKKNQQADMGPDMGNQVSAMLVGLATDLADPVQRLRQISRGAQISKIYASALPANRITEFIPSETLAAAARLYTRTRLGGRHRPFFNLIITNVPGPPMPLYLAGARLTQQFGMAPILDGLGLIIVVLSYAGRISLGLTSCYRVIPDPDHLGSLLDQALLELEQAPAQPGAGELPEAAEKMAAKNKDTADRAEPLQRLRRATAELDAAIAALTEKTKIDDSE